MATEEQHRTEQLKAVGQALARAVTVLARWIGERIQDASMWIVNLIRDLPIRVGRLAVTTGVGIWGLVCIGPAGVRAARRGGLAAWARAGILHGAAWLGILLMRVLDLAGIPELFSVFWRAITHSTPLTGTEIAALAPVLGPTALRYGDVRVAEGGILRLIFALNRGRAFTTFHTVNLPSDGAHRRLNLEILLHEMVHVYQHERVGSVYLGECIYAQATVGYGYGGTSGLRQAYAAGKHYRDYNREQQAQIVQDYFVYLCHAWDVIDFKPFIEEMCRGRV
jgi:hypothetical protein